MTSNGRPFRKLVIRSRNLTTTPFKIMVFKCIRGLCPLLLLAALLACMAGLPSKIIPRISRGSAFRWLTASCPPAPCRGWLAPGSGQAWPSPRLLAGGGSEAPRSRAGPEDHFCAVVRNDLQVPLTVEGKPRTLSGPSPDLNSASRAYAGRRRLTGGGEGELLGGARRAECRLEGNAVVLRLAGGNTAERGCPVAAHVEGHVGRQGTRQRDRNRR
jgi:hypothetical protein